MKADKAHSSTCMDLYVFATPYRVTWTWYFISRPHTVEFPEWDGQAEYDYVGWFFLVLLYHFSDLCAWPGV